MYETFLLSVPILASLEGYERAKIADALESRTFQSGEQVIQEGESGDEFYIIESGTALVEKSDTGVIGELKRGDYFGGQSLCTNLTDTVLIRLSPRKELALLNRAPRAATVKAGGQAGDKLRVAALGEKAFTRLLGPVREIMARKAGEMYGLTGAYRS
jgi:cAMP-dependent protein kinase regulator